MKNDNNMWNQIEQDRKYGASITDICNKYNINYDAITRARKSGKLNDIRDRPAKQNWKAIQEVIDTKGVDAAIEQFNTTINSLYTANANNKITLDIKHTKKAFKCYNVDELQLAVDNSICWSDVCKYLNITVCTYNYNRIKQLCNTYNILTTHFDTTKSRQRNKHQWNENTLFIEHCTISRGSLRPVLIRLGYYTGKCENCDTTDNWNGKSLTLEIDHINGNSSDNRKENLRWLCPNCHSQTDTYRRRIK